MTRIRRPALAASAAAAAAAVVLVGSITCDGATERAVRPAGSVYWGAWVGSHLTGGDGGWDAEAVKVFESHAGKPLSLVMISSPWQDCSDLPCLTHHFPAAAVQAIRDYGAIPVLSWGSQSTPSTLDQPSMRLSNIYGGAWDGFLSSYATQVREWGHPLFLRFNWEMNGDWFPWAEGVNGNAAGDYVRAWRHVVDAFRAAGADNVTWVWCPNTAFGGSRPIDRLYPGDEYVDWTCIDGYNWGSLRDTPWTSFGSLFRRSYDRITEIAAGKPMLVGETGSSERGGDKAAWLRDALRAITSSRTFPAIRAFMYFNNTVEGDWPIESSRAAQDAFREGIGSPAFTGNEFGTLSGRAPIGPPR